MHMFTLSQSQQDCHSSQSSLADLTDDENDLEKDVQETVSVIRIY